MYRRQTIPAAIAVLAMFLVAPLSAVAADKPTHESVLVSLKDAMAAGVTLLAEVKDDDTAKKAAEGLRKETEKLVKLKKEAEGVGPLSKEDSENLRKKFEDDMKKTRESFKKEIEGLKGKLTPLTVDSQKNLGDALTDYGKKLEEVSAAMRKWEVK